MEEQLIAIEALLIVSLLVASIVAVVVRRVRLPYTVALVLVGLFWNGSGALTLGLQGTIRWDWIPVLLVASMLGGYIGAHYSIMKGNRWIKRVYEGVTLLVGLKLIIG